MRDNNLYTVHLVRDVFTDTTKVDSKNEMIGNMSLENINVMIDKFNKEYGDHQNHFFGYKGKGFTWDFNDDCESGKVMIAVLDSKDNIVSYEQIINFNKYKYVYH